MEMILKFDPELDAEYFRRLAAADNLCSFITDFQEYLRGQWKYSEKPDDIGRIYDRWFEIMSGNGVNMENIYT